MLRTTLASGFVVVLAAPAFAQRTLPGLAPLDHMEVPAAVHRATITGALPATTPLHLSIALAPRDQEGLEAFVASVSDPKSPNYRRFLTPAQVGERFGVSNARLQAITAYFKGQGMKVVLVPDNRLSILVDATAAQAERAFDTRLARFKAVPLQDTDRAEFFANTETPKLPSSFSSSVVSVQGLDNATKPVPRMALTPTQTQALYKASSLANGGFRGQGRTLAISNYDGFRLSNVPLYYTKYNLPAPAGGVGSNIKVVTVGTGAQNGNAQGEGDLDIQMVLGQAPLCNFTIYDSTGDLLGVLTREVNDNTADVISESWGWRLDASTAQAAHNLHLSMSAQGITYLAATGDSGTNFKTYDYPDFEPEVLAVGGTVANVDANGNRTSEVGWNQGGGGWSTFAASFNVLPAWQKGNGVPTNVNKRLVPDISLHASGGNSGAYPFYLNGTLTSGYVGTSFASPVLAGMLGLAQQKLDSLGYFKTGPKRFGRLQDLIYAQNGRSDVYTDITSGANGTLPDGTASTARVGWDTVTGWGAINVEGFVNALAPVVTTRDFAPTAVSIFAHGTQVSGGVSSLAATDGDVYAASSVAYNGFQDLMVLTNNALPVGTTGSAKITLVASAPSGVTGQLLLHNYKTNGKDAVANSTVTFTGSLATYTFTVPDVTSYVSANGTFSPLFRLNGRAGQFTLSVDKQAVTLP